MSACGGASARPAIQRGGAPWGRRIVACLALAACAVGTGAVRVDPWVPIFQGVEFTRGEADAGEPRIQRICALRVDLLAPGIEFVATPANGDRPLETTSETTAEFLSRHRLQAAVNANFYSPCCAPGEKDLTGLAISAGVVVSAPLRRGRGAPVLVITRSNEAAILPFAVPEDLPRYWTAVAGSDIILEGGSPVQLSRGPLADTPHPRSAVGLSRNGRLLIILTIDGRQPGHSQGATLAETAAWLLRLGAHRGLNLDGGGSTTLVREEGGRAVILNRVSGAAKPAGDGSEDRVEKRLPRSVGNNLGLKARPLDGKFRTGLPFSLPGFSVDRASFR